MSVQRKTVTVVGVQNYAVHTALDRNKAVQKQVDAATARINDLGAPVQDQEYDAHYNGQHQQESVGITSTKELTKLAGAATEKEVDLEGARDAFHKPKLPFLNTAERKGAEFLANVVGEIELSAPKAPDFEPKLKLSLPDRKEKYTMAEAKKLLAEKFPNGSVYVRDDLSISNVTHQLSMRGNELGSVKLEALFERIFTGGAKTPITPASLRFDHLDGDPYTPESKATSKGGAMLSHAERAAAQVIYAALFVPERLGKIDDPPVQKTPITKFGAVEVYMETKTNYWTYDDGRAVDARTSHTVIVKAPPGTTILYGEGANATLSQTHVVGKDGKLELNPRNSYEPFAARVLTSKDPMGLLSPTVAGSFAVKLPEDDRKLLYDEKSKS